MTAVDWNKYLPRRRLSLAKAMRSMRGKVRTLAKAGVALIQSRLYAQVLTIFEITLGLLCLAAGQLLDATVTGAIALGIILQIRTRTVVLRGNGVTTMTELDWETLQAIAALQKRQGTDA